MPEPRFLLLQVRNQHDPMRTQEVESFAENLDCAVSDIATYDLLTGTPTASDYQAFDAVFIGGSGDYSAAGESEWLEQTLEGLRLLAECGVPTFASCWGFQALARALGGRCIHDPQNAELGTIELRLTEAGQNDPLFRELGVTFLGQAGHEDHVVELPPGVTLLASSDTVTNQAFKINDAPVYCTQFHPELWRNRFLERIDAYPRYVEYVTGQSVEEFIARCRETPETNELLRRFVRMFVG